MNSTSEIQQELNALNITIPIIGMPEMQIPQGYFQRFQEDLENIVHHELIPETNFTKEMPYEIPNHYFEHVSKHLLEQIQVDAFLDTLPKSSPYQIPSDYFEELPSELLSKIKLESEPTLKVYANKNWVSKLSLAATLLLFMGLAFKGLMNNGAKVSTNIQIEHELANVSDIDIQLYLQQHTEEIEASMVINNYEESNVDLNKLETEVLDQALNKISEEELKQYTF